MKQAVILAAGEGQRLRPFTVTRPKAMISIADKPILQFIVESLARNGIRDIIFVVGYRKEQVYDYMGSGEQFGVKISYVTQETQLGTAHALSQVKDMVENEFLVLPGDNLIEAPTIADFIDIKPEAVLVKRVNNPVAVRRGEYRGRQGQGHRGKAQGGGQQPGQYRHLCFHQGCFQVHGDGAGYPES